MAGLLDLDRRVVVVAGRDRVRFLHAVTTARFEGLEPPAGVYGALTDDRGHPVSDFHGFLLPHAILLEADAGRVGELAAALERLVVADDVTVAEAPCHVLALESGDPALVSRILGLPVEAVDDPTPGAGWPAGSESTWGHAVSTPEAEGAEAVALAPHLDGVMLRASRVGGWGVGVLVPAAGRAAREAGFEAAGAVRFDRAASEALAIEAGRTGSAELAETRVWNELGVTRAIDLDKGCFPGQEILRRVHVRGETRRRLAGLAFAGPGAASPEDAAGLAGAALADDAGTAAGRVTRAAFSSSAGAVLALAFVRRDVPAGARLAVRPEGAFPERTIHATVATLPFVRRRAAEAPAPDFEPQESP